MKDRIKAILRALLHAVSQNLGWKIFSLAAAILMWSYIVSSDPTITRDKTISGVEIHTSGLSVLQSRDLALLTDPMAALQDVRVRVEVPQANYSRVTADTVRVELDLSQIRQTGRQEVELTGVSNYGEVVQITPSRLEVVVETLDQRNVPINVELTGSKNIKNYWYNVSRVNPSVLTVSGPSSVVQNITSARVQVDVTGATNSYNWTLPPELLDASGEVISRTLSKSSSSVSVGVQIYPVKQLQVLSDIETATTGTILDGYKVSRIEVQPEIISVAAEKELLDELESITFTPINVTGRSQSFSATVSIGKLSNIQHYSSEQVTVTVYIEELTKTETFSNIPLLIVGKEPNQKVSLSEDNISVKVTGLHSVFDDLMRKDISARVNITDLNPGVYTMPVQVLVDNYPDLTFELEPPMVSVTIE